MTMTERQLAAAKADKYIGRDGSDPRAVPRHADVALLAAAVSRLIMPAERDAGMAALARLACLPLLTVRQMADDCPF